ncbi:pol, partial [Symbiodinium sp. KB8]
MGGFTQWAGRQKGGDDRRAPRPRRRFLAPRADTEGCGRQAPRENDWSRGGGSSRREPTPPGRGRQAHHGKGGRRARSPAESLERKLVRALRHGEFGFRGSFERGGYLSHAALKEAFQCSEELWQEALRRDRQASGSSKERTACRSGSSGRTYVRGCDWQRGRPGLRGRAEGAEAEAGGTEQSSSDSELPDTTAPAVAKAEEQSVAGDAAPPERSPADVDMAADMTEAAVANPLLQESEVYLEKRGEEAGAAASGAPSSGSAALASDAHLLAGINAFIEEGGAASVQGGQSHDSPTATTAAYSDEVPVIPAADAEGLHVCPDCGKGLDSQAIFPAPTGSDQFRQDFRGQWFRVNREGVFFELTVAHYARSSKNSGQMSSFPSWSREAIPSPGGDVRGPSGIEMRDDPDEQEQIRRLRERGSHQSAPVTPPKARAAGVEYDAGAASSGGAQQEPDPPGQPIFFDKAQYYRWGTWVCYFSGAVNPPEADDCFYQPVGGPHTGARCGGKRVTGAWCPDDNIMPWSAPEEWRNSWEATRLQEYEDVITPDLCAADDHVADQH